MVKKLSSLLLSVFLITVLLVVVTTKTVYAYIEIASAGYLLQILLAVSVASLFAIKVFWHSLLDRAHRLLYKFKRSKPSVE